MGFWKDIFWNGEEDNKEVPTKASIRKVLIEEMLEVERQIAQDSINNKWTKKEESRILSKRIEDNKVIQSIKKMHSFTFEEFQEILEEVAEKMKYFKVISPKKTDLNNRLE